MSMGSAQNTPTEAAQEDYVLSVKDLLSALRRRLWLIVLPAVVLAGIAVALGIVLGLLGTPTYEANSRLIIGREEQPESAQVDLGNELEDLQTLTTTVTQAVDTRPVAEEAIERLDLQEDPEEVLDGLGVQRVGQTQFVDVTYESEDPEEAQQVVNTVGSVFSERVSDLGPNVSGITVTVWEEAPFPPSPESSLIQDTVRNGLIALVIGGVLGMGLALFSELLDRRWHSPEEIERASGFPNFGVIPKLDGPVSHQGAKAKKGKG